VAVVEGQNHLRALRGTDHTEGGLSDLSGVSGVSDSMDAAGGSDLMAKRGKDSVPKKMRPKYDETV